MLKREVRVFKCGDTAADGSTISEEVVKVFISSPEHRFNEGNKLIMGGLTHKDRNFSKEYEAIGEDDTSLINYNTLFWLDRFYVSSDGWLMATLNLFNPEKFEGKMRENLMYLNGLIEEGVNLSGSVVIDATWRNDNACEKIISIKGYDITLNPSFYRSGITSR
jgi:hypothetical protein